jgi:protein-S-isoprenylcysteine O-methyltransferase Ste14
MALAATLWLAFAVWLLLGGGLETLTHLIGRPWPLATPLRRTLLAAALSIYYLRLLLTWFVFLKRGIRWAEAATIIPWLLIIDLTFALLGGLNPNPLGPAAVIALALFLLGSWMNSFAEYQRLRFKRDPAHRGHLYTGGLFRLCRHPNYLGDLLSFSGLALLTGRWPAFSIPILILFGFVFSNIPALDAHLHRHYGPPFDAYAAHTSRLIPFLY